MIIDLKYQWYEIFHHLGFSHEQLARCKDNHSLEPDIAMLEMISQWTEGTTVTPSWESLVAVLRYQLLENDVANKIEKAHCLQEESTNAKCK